jgi:squalene cyclase
MPADFDRAIAFVLAHGSDVERYALVERCALLERADGYQYNVTPLSEVERQLLEGQRADGGWAPFWASDRSSLDATCYRVAQAEIAALLLLLPFKSALEFLRSRQRQDGSWEEDESVRDLAPHWAKPGDLAARLYLTANCGWWLISARNHGHGDYKDEAARAGAYLERRQAEDGSLPSFLQTHWLAAALWIRLNREKRAISEQAIRALDSLATQLNDETPAGALGWMLTTLAGLGVQPENPAIVKALALLNEQQRPDGGWTSEDGPERDTWVTLQALLALNRWEMGAPDGLSDPKDMM